MKNRKRLRSFALTGDATFHVQSRADGSDALPTFDMTAYTGGLLHVRGFYRPVVIDLVGLSTNDRTAILFDHDTNRIVGQSTKVTVRSRSIKMFGVITGDGEAAREVVSHAKNGFQWPVSVGVEVHKVESVGENAIARVNGRSFRGPVDIVRAGRLTETSFTAVGADENATATVAASAKEFKDMDFENWLEARGFNPEKLDDTQTDSLQAIFDAEIKAKADAEIKAKADADLKAKADADLKAKAANGPGDGKSGSGGSPTDPPDSDSVNDVLATVRAEAIAETKRIAGIRKLCAGGDHAELEAKAIEGEWTLEKTELAVLRANRPSVGTVRRGSNGQGGGAQALEAALCLSAGVPEDFVNDEYDERTLNAARSRDLQGAGLHSLIHETVRAAGGHISLGRIDNDSIRTAFECDRRLRAAGSGFSTISLTGILGNVANKAMLAAYRAVNSVAGQIAGSANVNDFKQVTRYRLTGVGTFEKVGPDGELKHATLSEDSYTNQIDTYGKIIALTRQMMINDDLGAFLQIPRIIGRMSALALENALFELLLSNPSSFFASGNNNYFEGAATNLQISSLTTAEQLFRDQTDSDGQPILLSPAVLLVPTAVGVIAQQLMTETRVNETTTANKAAPANNPHAGKWKPVISPYMNAQGLSGSSALAWYLIANPADLAFMEVAYLRGRKVPTIESGDTDFNTLGVQWRGFFDFGVAMQDTRAAIMSKGEA